MPGPIVLPANRPPARFYRGGARIAELRSISSTASHEPEDWIASTVHVFGRPDAGGTTLPDGRRLADAVEADPEGWLGPDHVARWGADPKLLVKLLDAGQRLPVHAHPDGAFAAEHLGHAHGKAEAWVILTAGTVHLGLQEDVAPEALRALVDAQDVQALLALLHRIEVEPGDAVLVPPGQLHAIGEGVLLLEVQEPEDLSILLEWRGFDLDGSRDGHLGLGFDTALDAVAHRRLDEAALAACVRRGDGPGPVLPEVAEAVFRVDRIEVDGDAELPQGWAVLLVVEGEVRAADGSGTALPRGTTALLPWSAGPTRLRGTGTVLLCRPPRP